MKYEIRTRPLYLLMPRQKAALLHQLFPEEMPSLMNFIEDMALTIQENQESERRNWNHEHLSFDEWMRLLDGIRTTIRKHRQRMYKSPKVFANMLFGNQNALFSMYCIDIFLKTAKKDNVKYMLALEMLFKPLL